MGVEVEKLRKFLKQFTLKSDIINLLVGIALIVSLIFIYQNPLNKYAILAACVSGGLINIMNGLKLIKDPKKKTSGMTYLMMGSIVVILGFIIVEIL
jgi:predicted membrane channel-forming protein YqfA (hemolysin III family)